MPFDHDEALTMAADMIEAIESHDEPAESKGRFTLNTDTNFVHVRAQRQGWERTIPGRANCGWDYKSQRGLILTEVPETAARCGKCARPATWVKFAAESQPLSSDDE